MQKLNEKVCTALLFPSGGSNPLMFVVVTHLPMLNDFAGRLLAFEEMADFLTSHRKLGLCILGGDFNSRCAVNGDAALRTCGSELLEFCEDNTLCMVNSLEDVCSGEFSREQQVCRDGVTSWDKTTIDYMLIDMAYEPIVKSLVFLDLDGLVSDHKPLV